jgi:hypothetical protein
LEGKSLPETQGPHTAVILDFSLGSGSYATMLIRELTKKSTSQKSQRELQEEMEKAGLGNVRPIFSNTLVPASKKEGDVFDEENELALPVNEEPLEEAEGTEAGQEGTAEPIVAIEQEDTTQ